MKARVAAEDLATALAAVKPAVGRDKPFARLTLEGDQLEVAADDLRVGVRATISAWRPKGADDAQVMVPHRPLASLASMSTGDLEIVATGVELVTIKGDAEMTLPQADLDWFPSRPEPTGTSIDLDEDQWAAVRRLLPFTSAQPSKPIYAGVWFGPEGIGASDDHQAAIIAVPFAESAIVPAESLAAIREDGKVSVVVGDRSVKVTHSGGIGVTASSIAGDPPLANAVKMLTPGKVRIEVDADELNGAMARCALTARSIFGKGYKLVFTPHKRGIEIRSDPDPSNPSAITTEVVDAECYGWDIELGVNSAGLTDVMAFVGFTEAATIHLNGKMAPIICTQGDLTAATMPMHIGV